MWFLSKVHNKEDVDTILNAAEDAIREVKLVPGFERLLIDLTHDHPSWLALVDAGGLSYQLDKGFRHADH